MNKLISQLFIFGLVTVFFSCEKTVSDFEIERHPEKIVLNSIFQTDSTIRIELSKSMSIDASTENLPYITDGIVILHENGSLLDTLSYSGNGNYTLDYFPKPGALYELTIMVDGFEKVTASMTMPEALPAFNVTLNYDYEEKDPFCRGCSNNYWELKVFTSDQVENTYTSVTAAFENAYYLDCMKSICEKRYDSINKHYYDSCYCVVADTVMGYNQDASVKSDDIQIHFTRTEDMLWLADASYTSYGSELFLQDKSFIEESPLVLIINRYQIHKTLSGKMKIKIRAYNKPVYDFLLSLARAQYVEHDPFAEKVTLYGNIENGLGIFGGFVSTYVEIPVDYSELDGIKVKW